MDPQALDLSKRAARLSVPYAGGIAAALALLGWIPCLNCLVFLAVYLAGPFVMGYLVTPRLSGFPAGQSKAMLALYIGLGVGAAFTVAVVVASLITSILGLVLGSAISGAVGGLEGFNTSVSGSTFSLILSVIGAIFGGLIFGIGLAFLGSFVSLGRNRTAEVARPF